MIRSLYIHNYAIIEELEIYFHSGLTTITGETGAGKSILLGALGLVLGNRGDASVMKNKEQKCIVEGVFKSGNKSLLASLRSQGIDEDGEIILRREISPNGKSRAFINDTPVNLQILKEIGDFLIDIHSQHENLNLGSNLYQLRVLDSYSSSSPFLEAYQVEYLRYSELSAELEQLIAESGRARSELEYLEYQYSELEKAKLREGEMTELEQNLDILSHAEEIKNGLNSVAHLLSGQEQNAIGMIRESEIVLLRLAKFFPPANELYSRIGSVLIEIKDITAEIEKLAEHTEVDPHALTTVQDRMGMLFSLMKKHNVREADELIMVRNTFHEKILSLQTNETRIPELRKELEAQSEKVILLAQELSKRREASFPEIENTIIEILLQLGMPNAQFRIQNTKLNSPGLYGIDSVRFLFTANRKSDLQDIAKIASGGELSRLMLAIKYIISGSLNLPTLIFDEIDTGVSGEIAYKVGKIMKEMSEDLQVFAITHLPQVAARGHQHLLVYKEDIDSGTVTRIRSLENEDRLAEIARMLSGEQTTEAALANAKELLSD